MLPDSLVYFIQPSSYLAVLIAYTVAMDVLPIFETQRPTDDKLRQIISVCKMYLKYILIDVRSLNDDIKRLSRELKSYNPAMDSYEYIYIVNTAVSVFATLNSAIRFKKTGILINQIDASLNNAADVVYYAALASSEEHIFNLILSLFPQMINYAVENQIKLFTGPGDFSEIFEMLTDEQKKLVIYNMDVIGNWK